MELNLLLLLAFVFSASAVDTDGDRQLVDNAETTAQTIETTTQTTSGWFRQLFLPNFGGKSCPNLPTAQTSTLFRATAMENYHWFEVIQASELEGVIADNETAVEKAVPASKNKTSSLKKDNKQKGAAGRNKAKPNSTSSYRELPTSFGAFKNPWMEMWTNTMKLPTMTGNGNAAGGFQLPSFGGGSCASLPAQRITPHFEQWLDAHGYKDHRFVDNGCGKANSFGGRQSDSDTPSSDKRPVIFVHGNSDCATGSGNMAGMSKMCGWTPNINFFMQKAGYKMADLYALTWGLNEATQASQQTHNKIYLQRINKFIEAVLDYTKATKVDIISHSMGVTLARGAIVGINGCGSDLSSRVANFIGIAGANRGLSTCTAMSAFVPTCNAQNGFAPSSRYLAEINGSGKKIADNVFSIWSPGDTLVNCETISPNTCFIPGQKCAVKVSGLNHIPVRDQTSQQQLTLLKTGQC